MAPSPIIRPGGARDGIAVSALFAAARRASLGFLPILHTRDEDDAFFTAAIADHSSWVAVDAEDRPLAFTVFDNGYLEHLYVHPSAQGIGVGSALLDRVKEVHPEGFSLYVFQRNVRARRFYEGRGFRAVAFGVENEEHEPDILERWPGSGGS